MKIIINANLLFLFFLFGCATTVDKYADFLRSNSNITYDDAIMYFGEPTNITEGKNVYIVTWDKQKQHKSSYSEKVKVGDDVHSTKNGRVTTIRPRYKVVEHDFKYTKGVKIIITFYKSSDRMKYWKVCSNC